MTACEIYVMVAENLLHGCPIRDAVYLAGKYSSLPEFSRLGSLDLLNRSEISSTGYVVDTLEAALWCLLNTDNYRDCVLTAVNLGDDTDTIAAVAGGLAGIIYGVGGEKGIPLEWIETIAHKEGIAELCKRFDTMFGGDRDE
jgi:ADP-ribosylglycohydrolase